MKKYEQLTPEKRYQMEAIFATQPDITQKEVAQILGVHPSTVSRELMRFRQSNSTNEYKAKVAQQQSEVRRKTAKKFTKLSEKLLNFIVRQMA